MQQTSLDLSNCEESKVITKRVMDSLQLFFPRSRCELVAHCEPYTNGDILIELDQLPDNWMELVRYEVKPDKFLDDGLLLTCYFGDVGLDILSVHAADFDTRKNIILDSLGVKESGHRKWLPEVPEHRQLGVDIVQGLTPNQLVAQYLLASYAYYQLESSPYTDTAFDYLCVRLLECFDQVTHPHKRFLSKDMLMMGTGFHISEEEYPWIVKGSIQVYISRVKDGSLAKDLLRIAEVGGVMWEAENSSRVKRHK